MASVIVGIISRSVFRTGSGKAFVIYFRPIYPHYTSYIYVFPWPLDVISGELTSSSSVEHPLKHKRPIYTSPGLYGPYRPKAGDTLTFILD